MISVQNCTDNQQIFFTVNLKEQIAKGFLYYYYESLLHLLSFLHQNTGCA